MNAPLVSNETWDLVGTLFDQLAALTPDERQLDTLDQPEPVRMLLEQMLAAHDTTDPQLLDRTVRAVAGRFLQTGNIAATDYRGRAFGPWRALEEIGRGGMAVVLRGERADGRFEKEVAIKLLPHAGRGVEHERLLEEIRILARLEHSNIARLIDGGVDPDGIAYLVMEYVRGVPITAYCAARALDPVSCVRLLMQVVDAVRLAHRHLVVHCDIKPGNILITSDGQAKLVDFGIAGLISGGGRLDPVPRGLFCSPAYCAPEQMRGAPPDTAQDIFSLGAVLYEVLCGQRIRNNQTATCLLFGAVPDAIAPPPPSRHARGIARDLDAICLKTLATRPGSRYASANALLMDLQRWLTGEPVIARAGGVRYRVGKWMRRHWLPAAAAGAAALALLIGAGVALWQAEQARRQAELARYESQRATAIKDFLVGMFEATAPERPRAQMPSLETLLELGVARARESAHSPALGADMRVVIGSIYRYAGQFDQAEALFSEADELYRRGQTAAAAEQVFDLRREQAVLASEQGDYAKAEQLLQALIASPLAAGRPRLALAQAYRELARVKSLQDKHEAAIALYRRELDLLEQMGDEAILQRSMNRNNLAVALNRAGHTQEALAEFEIAVNETRAAYGDRHRQTAVTLSNKAIAARRLGQLQRAEDLLREAIEIDREVFAEPHPEMTDKLNNLAVTLAVQDRYVEARTVGLEGVALLRRIHDPPHPSLAMKLRNLCAIERFLDHLDAAEAACREGLDNAVGSLGQAHSVTAAIERNLAMTLIEKGELDEAEALIRKSVQTNRETSGPAHPETILGISVIAQVLEGRGLIDDARETLSQALALDAQRDQLSLAPAIERQVQMLRLLHLSNEQQLARAHLRSLEENLAASPDLSARIQAAFLAERAALWAAEDDLESARADLQSALSLLRSIFPEEHSRIQMIAAVSADFRQ